jgi:hypothetical protein
MALFVTNIKIAYTEELIIYNFWKYGLGKVSRVEHQNAEYRNDEYRNDEYRNDEYRTAFIYPETKWNSELTAALEKDSVFRLDLTHNIDPPTTWFIREK